MPDKAPSVDAFQEAVAWWRARVPVTDEEFQQLTEDLQPLAFRVSAAKAVGWFEPAIKDDGLYATNIRWTAEGASLLTSKAYRYFSPT